MQVANRDLGQDPLGERAGTGHADQMGDVAGARAGIGDLDCKLLGPAHAEVDHELGHVQRRPGTAGSSRHRSAS
jgi:hypothetical protein